MPPHPSALAVSLSRHQACRACRTRKIRCDAQRPACAPCVKWAVSRGRDPDAVICSYDGDVNAHLNNHDGRPANDPQASLFLGPDPLFAQGKNEILEGRVAELESMLARQSATLAALLPSVAATADTNPSVLTSLIGLPIARTSSSSASSPDASGNDGSRPRRASSVASSSGSSMFTTEAPHRSSLDGVPFPPPILPQLPSEMDAVHAAALAAPPIAYPVLPSMFPAPFGQVPLTVTTSVPLGPHSVACNDPNCPDYLRAREAAAMRIPQPLSLGPSNGSFGGFAGGNGLSFVPLMSGPEPAVQNANASLQTILSDLGFATGIPSSVVPDPRIVVKTEEDPSPFSSVPQEAPAPLPPLPAPAFPSPFMDQSWLSAALGPPPPAAPPSAMGISPEVWNILFPASQQQAAPAPFSSMC